MYSISITNTRDRTQICIWSGSSDWARGTEKEDTCTNVKEKERGTDTVSELRRESERERERQRVERENDRLVERRAKNEERWRKK